MASVVCPFPHHSVEPDDHFHLEEVMIGSPTKMVSDVLHTCVGWSDVEDRQR